MKQNFTIGIAGHIDHGKTALTKALTGVNTDRLKEEQARSISIEPGFALLINNEDLEVAIIDVPGHENFIRQMIAGVAGIDMVIVAIAADEGIMPQTKEHLDILSLLGITNGLVVLTKIDQADLELIDIVIEDVKEHMKQTFLEDSPIYLVDSLSTKGIPELKKALREKLQKVTKKATRSSFRLPIDQVFTVKGQGAVVRGTIYDGEVRLGDQLQVLPNNQDVRVRQIQRHHQQTSKASEGQRAAINIGGIAYEDVSRGNVLVADDFFSVTDQVDIVFYPLQNVKHDIKQRQLVKLHIGTAEVMGTIVFFDRNEINPNEPGEVLCQLQLNEKIVVTRGDRFIVRRPTPTETIGGGWIIEANAKKHRFGEDTVAKLQRKKDGTAKDRVVLFLEDNILVSNDELVKQLSTEQELTEIKTNLLEIDDNYFTLPSIFADVKTKTIALLDDFHSEFPMRIGKDKAEIISGMKHQYPKSLLEFTLNALRKEKQISILNQYISLYAKKPIFPSAWKEQLEYAEKELITQGVEVESWNELLNKHKIPSPVQREFYYYLIETEKAFVFDDHRLISKVAIDDSLEKLKKHTELKEFNLQLAREGLELTRKNLVPLLELFDHLGYTKRVGNSRKWLNKVLN